MKTALFNTFLCLVNESFYFNYKSKCKALFWWSTKQLYVTGNWQTLQELLLSYSYPLDQQMPTFIILKNRNYLWVIEDGESSVSRFSVRGEKQLSNLLIKKWNLHQPF